MDSFVPLIVNLFVIPVLVLYFGAEIWGIFKEVVL